MTILSNSRIALGNVPGVSVNKRDKSYIFIQFLEGGGSKNNVNIAKQLLKTIYASTYFCNALP